MSFIVYPPAGGGPGGTGDVQGPASSTDNDLARFDGATGKLLKSGGPITDSDVDASANISQSKLNLAITDSEVDASANIAQSKLNLSITDSEVDASANISQSKLNLAITDSEVDASANISQSKLNLAITDSEIDASANISQSKLNLAITDSEIDASANIAQSKLNLAITDSEVDASANIAQSKLNLAITDSEIDASANISQSKLNLAITDSEVDASANISQSKLNLAITDSEVDASANIAQSKLNLSITDSEISASANIAQSKIAGLGTMASETATDYLTKAGNLSGLASQSTSRTNLGISSTGDSLVTAVDADAARTAIGAVNIAGDTMTGILTLSAAPTNDLEAATKKYVDDGLATKENSLGFTPVNSALTDSQIYVGNSSNVATGVALSGDATLSNAGVLTIANNAITETKINDAAVTPAKIAPGSNGEVLTTVAGVAAWAAPSGGGPSFQTLTDGANISWDLDDGNGQVTLAGDRTLDNPTNMAAGAFYFLIVKQDATGGRELDFGANYKWFGGVEPELSLDADAVDILFFVSDGTNMYGSIQRNF